MTDRRRAPRRRSRARPEIAICIVNWNTREYLRTCLPSVFDAAEDVTFEVVVVDNASTDGSAEMVRCEYPGVSLIANEDNLLYARGTNQAIEATTGPLVLLLNPDTLLPRRALADLRAAAEDHPQAGAIGCRLVYPSGTVQHSCRTFPTVDVLIYQYFGLSRLFPTSRAYGKYRMSWWTYDEEMQVDQPMGSALLLRRSVLDEVGLMDERFPMFFNEVDLCYRIKQAGYQVWFVPRPEIVHHVGASTRKVRREMIIASHEGLRRFYEKHYAAALPWSTYTLARLMIRSGCAVRLAGQYLWDIMEPPEVEE